MNSNNLNLNISSTMFDKQYGRLDFAPRIMGRFDYDGDVGYLLAWNPMSNQYLVLWDNDGTKTFLSENDFTIISGVVH